MRQGITLSLLPRKHPQTAPVPAHGHSTGGVDPLPSGVTPLRLKLDERREVERDLREDEQDRDQHDVDQHKRQHASEDLGHIDPRGSGDHETVDTHRRRHHADFDQLHDEDREPHTVEPELRRDRIQQRHGDHQDRDRFQRHPKRDQHQEQERHGEVTVPAQADHRVGEHPWHLRDHKERRENPGPNNDREDHRGRSGGLFQCADDRRDHGPGAFFPHFVDEHQHRRECAHRRRFRRGEQPGIHAPEHDEEQECDADHTAERQLAKGDPIDRRVLEFLPQRLGPAAGFTLRCWIGPHQVRRIGNS